MDYYLLALYVSFEQEQAIRELFLSKGWDMVKCEADDVNLTSCKRLTYVAKDPDVSHSPEYSKEPCSTSYDENNDQIPGVNENYKKDDNDYIKSWSEDNTDSNFGKLNDLVQRTCHKSVNEMQDASHAEMSWESDSSGIEQSTSYSASVDFSPALDLSVKAVDPYPVCQEGEESCDSDDTVVDYQNTGLVGIVLNEVNKFNTQELDESAEGYGGMLTDIDKTDVKSEPDQHQEKHSIGKIIRRKKTPMPTKKKKARKEQLAALGKDKPEQSFYCKDCDYTYKLLGQFKRHKRDGRCIFECELCGKSYTSRTYAHYLVHLKRHKDERPYKCDKCDKAYRFVGDLNQHMKSHDAREIICQHCGKEFITARALFLHCKTMHDKDRVFYKCDVCNASLASIGNLKIHKRDFHSNEKPFVCEVCGKSFKCLKTLQKVHALVHSDDMPYKCTYPGCEKKFKRSAGLKFHVQRHNNDRRFPCDSCEMRFYSKADLVNHGRTHTGEKPYECSYCGYRCALYCNLQKHLKIHKT